MYPVLLASNPASAVHHWDRPFHVAVEAMQSSISTRPLVLAFGCDRERVNAPQKWPPFVGTRGQRSPGGYSQADWQDGHPDLAELIVPRTRLRYSYSWVTRQDAPAPRGDTY